MLIPATGSFHRARHLHGILDEAVWIAQPPRREPSPHFARMYPFPFSWMSSFIELVVLAALFVFSCAFHNNDTSPADIPSFLLHPSTRGSSTSAFPTPSLRKPAARITSFLHPRSPLGALSRQFAFDGPCYSIHDACSLRYFGLQMVSFPIVLMSKSCKLIVVMIGGVLILGKKYQSRDYLAAAAIIVGLYIFQSDSTKSGSSSLVGVGVLLLSLAFDSLNSNYNEKVVATNKCCSYACVHFARFG